MPMARMPGGWGTGACRRTESSGWRAALPDGRLPGAVEGGRAEGEQLRHVGREPDGGIAQVHDLVAHHEARVAARPVGPWRRARAGVKLMQSHGFLSERQARGRVRRSGCAGLQCCQGAAPHERRHVRPSGRVSRRSRGLEPQLRLDRVEDLRGSPRWRPGRRRPVGAARRPPTTSPRWRALWARRAAVRRPCARRRARRCSRTGCPAPRRPATARRPPGRRATRRSGRPR